MTTPTPSLPQTDSAADLAYALQETARTTRAYDKRQAYADGPVREIFVSHKIRRIMRRSGVNFQELLGDVVIDAVADRLHITTVQADDDNATAAITATDKANALNLVRPQLNRLTLKMGDYYLFAWPRETGGLRIVMVDPRQARLFYEPDDPMTPRYGIRWWVRPDKHKRVDLLYRDRVESYVTKEPGVHATAASQFEPYTVPGNSSHEAPHDFDRPPLFHFSTDLPGEYGCAEHERFMATQDILIKLTLSHMSAVDYTAIPQRYAIMDADSDTTEAEDQDDTLYRYTNDGFDPDERVHQMEGVSSLRSEPGELWYQKGIKQYGEFPPAPPNSFLEPAVHHLKIGATASATPLWYFEGFGSQPAAGVALRSGMEPLLSKTRARRDTLDHSWCVFYGAMLRVLGFPDAEVTLTWAPVEPKDEQETWTVAGLKQDRGVPVDVTLKEGGYDGAVVDGWQRQQAMALPQRIELLGQVGDFLASAATAVAGGSAAPEQIAEILAKVIGPLDVIDGVDSDDPSAR